MWLVAHGRLLTNTRRHKWNTTTSPTYQACNQVDETQMHVLRDCIFATRVWLRLLLPNRVATFFEHNDSSWVFENLTAGGSAIQGHNWKTIFMVTIWYLWQWRNRIIFEEGFQRPFNVVDVILNFVGEIATTAAQNQTIYNTDIALIRWQRPEVGWTNLKSDGASRGADHRAACGGLLRDDIDEWLYGFTRRLGAYNTLQAEMWIGIHTAKQRGITNLIVERDSKLLVDMLTSNDDDDSDRQHSLARCIKQLLTDAWETKVVHTWREGNRSVDWLTAWLPEYQHGDHHSRRPSWGISQFLIDDMVGSKDNRLVVKPSDSPTWK